MIERINYFRDNSWYLLIEHIDKGDCDLDVELGEKLNAGHFFKYNID